MEAAIGYALFFVILFCGIGIQYNNTGGFDDLS